jgi:hypothetical protein
MNNKYKCKFCDNIYQSSNARWFHTNKFHKEIKEQYNSNNSTNCLHCNKDFSTKGSLTRHLKNGCKIKNIINNYNTNNNTNNINPVNITINNNNNTQNNLTINNIKNPSIIEFNLLDICDIFEKEFDMILNLIDKTYFNINIEKNHSFYVSNLQGLYVNQYQDNIFTTKLKKYFFDELFGISLNRIKLLYKTYKNKLFEIPKQLEIKEKIQALEDMRNENTLSYKSYLKLINILAYDKKEVILKTFNKVKQLNNDTSNIE